MTATRVDLICFDLGGVLVRLCPDHNVALSRLGVALPDDFSFFHCWEQNADLFHDYEIGRMDEPTFLSRAEKALAPLTAEQIKLLYHVWLVELYPGVAELLSELVEHPALTCCLSNTNPTHWRELDSPHERFAELQQLDYRFASHRIGSRKPDPEPFAHVEQCLGVEPQHVMFFDDSPANVDAATRRGWQAHLIDPNGDPVAQMTRHIPL